MACHAVQIQVGITVEANNEGNGMGESKGKEGLVTSQCPQRCSTPGVVRNKDGREERGRQGREKRE